MDEQIPSDKEKNKKLSSDKDRRKGMDRRWIKTPVNGSERRDGKDRRVDKRKRSREGDFFQSSDYTDDFKK